MAREPKPLPELPPDIERRGMTVAHAAAVLGVSVPSIYKIIQRGRLPRPRKVAGIGARLDARAVQRLADETWGVE